MKKKTFLLLALPLMLIGCTENKSNVVTKRATMTNETIEEKEPIKYTKVHLFEDDYYSFNTCFEITDWRVDKYEPEKYTEVCVKEFGWVLYRNNQFVLIEDKCPFCAQQNSQK